MRLLLGSGGFRTPERIALLVAHMRAHFGDIQRLLFVPYALADHDGYVKTMRERGLDAGYQLEGLHTFADPIAAVEAAQGLFVGGGNTFRLLNELYGRKLLEPIRRRVRAGLPYLGVSAGCNVACPTMKTTNDMPIVQPPSLDALNLVPFQVNAHYFSGQTFVKHHGELVEHFGETRDERLAEFHQMNDTPVIGLVEAGILSVANGTVTLTGAPARLFRKGQPAVDFAPGATLDLLPLLYTVAVSISDTTLAESWLAWMHGGHIADVLAAGAQSAEVVALDSQQGKAFEARYRFASRQAFADYERDHAPRLREEGLRLFGPDKGVTYRRSTGVVV